MHKINTVGNPNKHYYIHLPNDNYDGPKNVLTGVNCLSLLGYYAQNVTIDFDHEKLRKRHPPRVKVGDFNHRISNFFLVNNHLFMTITCDCPTMWADKWTSHYGQYCTAFFVSHLRKGRHDIFKDSIQVFHLPFYMGEGVHVAYLETYGRSNLLSGPQDISVFFIGSPRNRVVRQGLGKTIREKIPNSFIHFSKWSQSHTHLRPEMYCENLSPEIYCDKLCRSKIAWCPRSIRCDPDHEENGIQSRWVEAMCCEILVIGHEPHLLIPEPLEPGVHYVKIQNNSSDLIEKIQYYLEHEDERKRIAQNGRLWWERNCSSVARSQFMINCCMESMGEISEYKFF